MEIADKRAYYNSIFSAIVVNDNVDDDPAGKGRVQIYIPSIHTNYDDVYMKYMTSNNKREDENKTKFPWATTMIENLKNGNIVFATNVNNNNDEFLVMGLDVNNPDNGNGSGIGVGGFDINGDLSGILELTMPIIIHNEVGIKTTDWPDNIPHRSYININPYDNGGWSIGLIQWHHARAFDCLFEICKDDSNWKSKATNTSLDLYRDLEKAVSANSSASYRTKYQANFHPTSGTAQYMFIQNLLGSDSGKKTQRRYASEDTKSSIEILTNDNNKICNPAIIIFLADIMNQYGPGLPSTIKEASRISNSGKGDMMEQLNEFRNWCKGHLGSYSTYINRRNTTYSYIESLYNAGKLSMGLDKTYANDGEYLVKGFVKRTTAPTKSDYWFKDGIGNAGFSMWSNGGNCTFYAWGRASEILGRKYDGATGNGVDYGNQDGKYKTGSKPRQGAIITWSKKAGGAGHVAIVEDVSPDGQTIWTSESGWQSFMFKYRERKNDGNWGAGSRYSFQNFKYII